MKWWLRALTTCILFLSRFSSLALTVIFFSSSLIPSPYWRMELPRLNPVHPSRYLDLRPFSFFIPHLIPASDAYGMFSDPSQQYESNIWFSDKLYAPIQLRQAHNRTLDPREEPGL